MPYSSDQMSLPGHGTFDPWRERVPIVNFQDGKYSMDLSILLFVEGKTKVGMPQAPKRLPNAPLGSCYNCGGDHLIKDCPYQKQPRLNHTTPTLAFLLRYFLECGIKHLVPNYLLNPKNKG